MIANEISNWIISGKKKIAKNILKTLTMKMDTKLLNMISRKLLFKKRVDDFNVFIGL